jgi:replicative DNA helicase
METKMENGIEIPQKFGKDYQLLLIAALLTDVQFTGRVIDKLNHKDFCTEELQKYFHIIKYNFTKKNIFINEERLIDAITYDTPDERYAAVLIDIFKLDIKTHMSRDLTTTKERCEKYITLNRQIDMLKDFKRKLELGVVLTDEDLSAIQSTKIINISDDEAYFNDEEVIRDTLTKDTFEHVKTGLDELDAILRGGIQKGTFGLFLAYSGTGKSTILSSIGSSCYLNGYNVMHIVWEDRKKDIHKKYITHQYNKENYLDHTNGINIHEIDTKVTPEDLLNKRAQKNVIKFIGVKTNVKTIDDVERDIKKYIKENGFLDVLILDYADLLTHKDDGGRLVDGWQYDIHIYRGLERLAQKYNIAIWTASQTSRADSNTTSVDTANIGGSIKKVQAAPLVIGISRTMEQKQFGCATITINKNRTGSDGFQFTDVIFDNGKMVIDLSTSIENVGISNTK